MTPQELFSWIISGVISLVIILYYSGKTYNQQWKKPKIKHNKLTKYNWMVSHPENLELGENTDIGAFTYIQTEYGVVIGKNVQIGSHCSIYSKNTIDKTKGKIIIEDNTCIGSHTIILPLKSGTTLSIGHDTIIGAHSLIKASVFPNSTISGIYTRRNNESKY